MGQALTIAVIGDVHLFWDEEDVRYFNASDYDLVLFVGDLAAYSQRGGRRVARSIARLRPPTIVLPGNHDGLNVWQLVSEIVPGAHRGRHLFSFNQQRRCQALDRALGGAVVAGYSLHRAPNGAALNIVAARPHSIGGRRVACQRHLQRAFGVDSMESSASKLSRLIDACDDAPILFLAHNGPKGLGAAANDIWGCDFRKQEEDWGDPDLTLALEYAAKKGRQVLGVVAGHMHRRTKKGKSRPAQVERDGVLFVNAAEVPRHRDKGARRHHVRLAVNDGVLTAEDRWVARGA